MFDTGNGRYSDGAPHQSELNHLTASETVAGYDATPSLHDALADVEAALAKLAEVDLDSESNREVLDAAVQTQTLVNQLASQQLRVIDAVDRRDAYADDAAVTTASWLRTRTRLTHAEVTAQVNAAQRLRRLDLLRDAFESGDVTYSHVKVVTSAAVPLRMDAIAAVEHDLVDLALHASPKELRIAVARVRDLADLDGADTERLCDHGPDERRDLVILDGLDGLGELRATLDPLDHEALRTLLDAFEIPDPADTPPERRRSAGQRRMDAFSAMLKALLASDKTPTVEGYRAQILCVVDLLSLLGLDTLTDLSEVSDAQLGVIGGLADVDLDTARRIAAHAIDRVTPTAGTTADGAPAVAVPEAWDGTTGTGDAATSLATGSAGDADATAPRDSATTAGDPVATDAAAADRDEDAGPADAIDRDDATSATGDQPTVGTESAAVSAADRSDHEDGSTETAATALASADVHDDGESPDADASAQGTPGTTKEGDVSARDPAGGGGEATVRAGPPIRDLPGLGQPARSPRMRFAGPVSPADVRRLADHAKIQALATMGPWRGVTVGDTMRNLPAWLRTALAALHSHCRGPDCDRPTSWTDAHHQLAWNDGGHTDVNQMAPLCRAHHTPVTNGEWTMTADCETGTTTWTVPGGHTITTYPPPLTA